MAEQRKSRFFGMSDEEVAAEERAFYKKNPPETLILTPTGDKNPYGMPVYLDQHGQHHSESSVTVKAGKGRWFNAPSIYPDEETGKVRYFTPEAVRKKIMDNNFVNPVNNIRVSIYESKDEAISAAIARDRALNAPALKFNQ